VTSAHGEPRVGDTAGVPGEGDTPVVVRDRRRIDPESGQVRPGAGPAPGDAAHGGTSAPPGGAGEPADTLRRQVQERTADLQRLKAEFDNYRRRVERDRQGVADQATARLLAALLPSLDDIGRAREHGDLEGPFKAVAETLEVTLEGVGLERFGSVGEEFDPLVHDALMHSYRSDVTRATCVEVFRSGYRFGGRVLRPAQVSVAEPESGSSGPLDSAPHEPPAAAGMGTAGEPHDHAPSDGPARDLPTGDQFEPPAPPFEAPTFEQPTFEQPTFEQRAFEPPPVPPAPPGESPRYEGPEGGFVGTPDDTGSIPGPGGGPSVDAR
jgi:molecular chaperone GrpE